MKQDELAREIVIVAAALHTSGLNAHSCPKDYSAESWNKYRLEIAMNFVEDFLTHYIPRSELMGEEEIIKVAEELFREESGIADAKLDNEINKHGLLNPNNWDDKDAGFLIYEVISIS